MCCRGVFFYLIGVFQNSRIRVANVLQTCCGHPSFSPDPLCKRYVFCVANVMFLCVFSVFFFPVFLLDPIISVKPSGGDGNEDMMVCAIVARVVVMIVAVFIIYIFSQDRASRSACFDISAYIIVVVLVVCIFMYNKNRCQ